MESKTNGIHPVDIEDHDEYQYIQFIKQIMNKGKNILFTAKKKKVWLWTSIV